MNNSKIIDVEELKGKIGAFTQYLIDEEKSNSTIEGYRRNVKSLRAGSIQRRLSFSAVRWNASACCPDSYPGSETGTSPSG